MPQLDLTRIFLDNFIWSLGFIILILAFILNIYILPYIENLWFNKYKNNIKISFKFKLINKLKSK